MECCLGMFPKRIGKFTEREQYKNVIFDLKLLITVRGQLRKKCESGRIIIGVK